MSLKLKVNFLKGWPNPYVVDFVSTNTPGSTAVDEGKIAHRNSTGQWVLGVANVNEVPHVLWNGAARDGDNNQAFPSTATAAAANQATVNWGGIQGLAFINALEFETSQFSGTPAFGDQLYADVDGLLKICVGSASVSNKVIVAIVTKVSHVKPGTGAVAMITVLPDNSKRLSP